MSLIDPSESPEQLGDYLLLRRLAVGGMGEVFVAEQSTPYFKRLVAIKRALPHLSAERGFVERLIDEARLMTRLHHGNIIHVHELRREESQLYMVMEYLPGLDLRSVNQRLKSRDERWPPALAAWVIREVCLGLDYAHKALDDEGKPLGVIHRDLSPSNILLGTEGEVKLIDFGVARARGGLHESVAGSLQGKLAYVSPEQARGEPLTLRSDLFSLGVTFYEMLSGRRALEGAHEAELLSRAQGAEHARLSEDELMSAESPAPLGLVRLVERAMAPEPHERFESAGQLAAELDVWLAQLTQNKPDRLSLKAWLSPLLDDRLPTLEGGHAASGDPFAAALSELIEGREGEDLTLSRGESGGVTVTLSLDVQAQVEALEAREPSHAPEGDEGDEGDEAAELDELGAAKVPEATEAQERALEGLAPQGLRRLTRARYVALSLLTLSALALGTSLRGERVALSVATQRSEEGELSLDALTVDGLDWGSAERYRATTPVELCAHSGGRQRCAWVTPSSLKPLSAYGDAERAELELLWSADERLESHVALLDRALLKELKAEPVVDVVEPDTQPDTQPDKQPDTQPDTQPDAELAPEAQEGPDMGLDGDEARRLKLRAEAGMRAEDPKTSPTSSLNRRKGSRGRPRTAQASRWYQLTLDPASAKLKCSPPDEADEGLKLRAREGLSCEVSAPGYASERVSVRGPKRQVKVKLKPLSRLNIRVIPKTAELFLDDAPVSNPLRRYELSAGAHQIKGVFTYEGQQWIEERAINLKPGERRSVVIELKPPARAPR